MKTEERAKEEKLAGLLKDAEGHPMMKAILAEKAAAVLAKRREVAGKIEALKKERDVVIPKLQADLAGKETKYLKAKAALEAASDEFKTAKHALTSESYQYDNVLRQHEAILIETADPAIDEAITFFRGKLDELRKPGFISSRGMETKRNLFTETVTRTTESNADAVRSVLAYCQAAIKGLESLKLSPEFPVELIQELKYGIPSIEEYQEVTGEKPMPESKGINLRGLFKSDDHLAFEMGRIDKKFKKLMKR